MELEFTAWFKVNLTIGPREHLRGPYLLLASLANDLASLKLLGVTMVKDLKNTTQLRRWAS